MNQSARARDDRASSGGHDTRRAEDRDRPDVPARRSGGNARVRRESAGARAGRLDPLTRRSMKEIAVITRTSSGTRSTTSASGCNGVPSTNASPAARDPHAGALSPRPPAAVEPTPPPSASAAPRPTRHGGGAWARARPSRAPSRTRGPCVSGCTSTRCTPSTWRRKGAPSCRLSTASRRGRQSSRVRGFPAACHRASSAQLVHERHKRVEETMSAPRLRRLRQ